MGQGSKPERALVAGKYEKDEASYVACAYAFRSDADQACAWLDKAVEYGDTGLSEIVTENLFANIRVDPRWLRFLRKIAKAPEQLAAIKFDVKVPK